jgi:hypothetical protein
MKKIKLPSLTTMLLGSLGAFWLANRMHLSFNLIGIMILLLVPIIVFETLYPQNEMDDLFEPAPIVPIEEDVIEDIPMGELVDKTVATINTFAKMEINPF